MGGLSVLLGLPLDLALGVKQGRSAARRVAEAVGRGWPVRPGPTTTLRSLYTDV